MSASDAAMSKRPGKARDGMARAWRGINRADWWTSAVTTCFLALSVSAGLRLVAVEVWRDHPYSFLHAWVPVTAMALLATWHLASAGMAPLWLFAAYLAGLGIEEVVVRGHAGPGRIAVTALIVAWVAALAWKPSLRPGRSPGRSVLAVVGLGLVAVLTCCAVWRFGPGVFNPWTEYPRWSEEPGARDDLDRISVGLIRSATAMDGTRYRLTYVVTPRTPGGRLSHGQADYLAHEIFCRDMAGGSKDGGLSFDFEFVDQTSAPLGTATMAAWTCHG